MGIIDVNLQKPALKREEKTDDTEMESAEPAETESSSKSRLSRSPGKILGIITTSIIGVLAIRRFRKRRSKQE